MEGTWRRTFIFVAGLLAGVLVLGALYRWQAARNAPPAQPVAFVPASPAAVAPQPAAHTLAASPATCGFEPATPARGAGDGQYVLRTGLSAREAPDPLAYVAVAREAAEAGRVRDAEVALITACRLAGEASPGPSAPLADIQVRLAQHYASLAAADREGVLRQEYLRRAQGLLGLSEKTYERTLGREASKTRMTARTLAALSDPDKLATLAGTTTAMGAPPELDEDLAQIDGDLRRLQAQAAAVTSDPAGFRQRAQAAEARRGSCGDRHCLQQWYRQRRAQLLGEF